MPNSQPFQSNAPRRTAKTLAQSSEVDKLAVAPSSNRPEIATERPYEAELVATAIVSPPLPTKPLVVAQVSTATEVSRPGKIRWTLRKIGSGLRFSFCLASLVALLAVLSAIPVLQLIAFGYLLDVAGRLTRGGNFVQSLPNLRRAGMIGMAAVAIFLASLPTQLLVHWESVAQLISPDSAQAGTLRVLAIVSSGLATLYLLWAWVRGGRLVNYLWPQPIRFLKESWRWKTWSSVPDQLWEFTVALEMPRLFWLGTRGAIGTLVWLVPGMIIIAVTRNGSAGVAGLFGVIAAFGMGISLMYLPMLQAHYAAEDRLRALFEVRVIREHFRRAPWAWLLAMIIGLVLMPIPLYLLKIEATPREVAWLPCLVFVAFILPARIAEGLALRRARRKPHPTGRWAKVSVWLARFSMIGVVGIYLAFLTISQFTSWDGLPTWVEQHAILFPRPFIGGV